MLILMDNSIGPCQKVNRPMVLFLLSIVVSIDVLLVKQMVSLANGVKPI